jgi:hypothetical protein
LRNSSGTARFSHFANYYSARFAICSCQSKRSGGAICSLNLLRPRKYLHPISNALYALDSYQVGTVIAISAHVSLLDFFITYLAIGSAFAMRAYFSNRHRGILFVSRSVLFELTFWLPKCVVWSGRKLTSGPAHEDVGSEPADEELWYGGLIDTLVQSVRSPTKQKRVREAAERYAVLKTAVSVGESQRQPGGQFELFEISGHRNGRTGTSCLFRSNLARLRYHSLRSAEGLSRTLIEARPHMLTDTKSKLLEFFDAFDDMNAIEVAKGFEATLGKITDLPCQANAGAIEESRV